MNDNPCLRPAQLSDVLCDDRINLMPMGRYQQAYEMAVRDLKAMYDEEWRKRGFQQSP